MQALAVLLICFLSITVCQACSSHTPAPSSGPIRESSTQESSIQESSIQEYSAQESSIQESSIQESFTQESSIQKSSIRESEAKRRAEKEKIPDGTYEPSSFTVQGGTGKVTITCPEVVVTDGGAQACIVFSSPYYEWVETEGVRYDPENAQEEWRETSVFRIPVRLNEQRKITGLTTAMSEPHEVEYTIIIGLTRESPVQEGSSQEGPSQDSPTQNEVGNTASVSSASERTMSAEEADSEASRENAQTEGKTPPDLPGLAYVSKMETAYAETFDIYTYRALDDTAPSGLYRLIDVHGSGRYLLLPESDAGTSVQQGQPKQGQPGQDQSKQDQPGQDQPGQDQSKQDLPEQRQVPAGLLSSITVLRPPLDNLYVAATSSMALFDAAGAIGQVKLTGTKAEGWYIDAPKKALQDGSMLYAGKYSAPDYELLASSGCDLAVESMMILHAPEVKEKLEELGIPVFIDTSSNESHPLGRTEWVRLYGVLTGHEEEAEAFFETQRKRFAEAESYTKTGSSVAFFSISANGHVIVRAADDYIPCMIGIAGGTYAFENLLNETGNSASVRLSMEDFYNTAKDADYLIYNAAIEKPVGSITELCGLSPLLADFKAVRSGRVWQVRRSLYQSPDLTAQMIGDIHEMLTEDKDSGMVFLEKIN